MDVKSCDWYMLVEIKELRIFITFIKTTVYENAC